MLLHRIHHQPGQPEVRNSQDQIKSFHRRLVVLCVGIAACCAALIGRWTWLQVCQAEYYAVQAQDNRIMRIPIAPRRGVIRDRHGVDLATNKTDFVLEVTPSKLAANVDSVIDELSKILAVESADRRRFKRLLAETRGGEGIVLRTHLSDTDIARFVAQRFRFPGVEVQTRVSRYYPLGTVGAHLVGYVGRISAADKQALDGHPDPGHAANYRGTAHLGKAGLERSYESLLHGTTGYEEVERAASGRIVRTLARQPAVEGHDLFLSIDIGLQRVVETAFGDMRGALVAIEPATGELLAYVSRPGFDPNLFVDGIGQDSWAALSQSPDRPLLDRPLSGTYPPASTFKPFMALAALENGTRRPTDTIHDPGYFMLGNHRFNDVKRSGNGVVDMYRSIVVSSDTYYYRLGNDMGIDAISGFMERFGFGSRTGVDLAHEKSGVLPSRAWKRARFGPNRAAQKWLDGDTISVAVGQGYNSYTMLQLAHATATLANDGVAMKPHLVKAVDHETGENIGVVAPEVRRRLRLKQENIDFVRHAMVGALSERDATGYRAFQGAPYTAGGKSGTAQVAGLKGGRYNHRLTPERLRDHALFIAFAPAEHPRIALALVVENGGWGAGTAAPIARKALDYYLLNRRWELGTAWDRPQRGE